MQGKAPRPSLGPVWDLPQDPSSQSSRHGWQGSQSVTGGVASGGGGKGEPGGPKQGVARG